MNEVVKYLEDRLGFVKSKDGIAVQGIEDIGVAYRDYVKAFAEFAPITHKVYYKHFLNMYIGKILINNNMELDNLQRVYYMDDKKIVEFYLVKQSDGKYLLT